MAYLSQFPSAENMLGVAPAASRSAGGLRLAARISSMAKAIGDYIDMMADFYAAATLYDELSRLSDTAGSRRAVKLSDDLWRVLQKAQEVSRQSDGAFDVTVGPAVRLWRRARRTKQMPDAERLAEARKAVGYQFLLLDSKLRTATLKRPLMRLDLGGIAAGYAADQRPSGDGPNTPRIGHRRQGGPRDGGTGPVSAPRRSSGPPVIPTPRGAPQPIDSLIPGAWC